MAENPRKILGLPQHQLAVGEPADLTLVDLDYHWTVDPEKMHSKAKNVIWKGKTLVGETGVYHHRRHHSLSGYRVFRRKEPMQWPFDRLIKRIDELHNPSVAGLDPRLEYVPQFIQDASFVKLGHTLEAAADAILQFNKALIDALYDVVPAIKPQAAYYEMYGWAGVRTLAETIRYAQSKGMFVMTDGKRNDIGATMTAYATAHLGKRRCGRRGTGNPFWEADALTVNGYLGTDGIQPLLDVCEKIDDKGIFRAGKDLESVQRRTAGQTDRRQAGL